MDTFVINFMKKKKISKKKPGLLDGPLGVPLGLGTPFYDSSAIFKYFDSHGT